MYKVMEPTQCIKIGMYQDMEPSKGIKIWSRLNVLR